MKKIFIVMMCIILASLSIGCGKIVDKVKSLIPSNKIEMTVQPTSGTDVTEQVVSGKTIIDPFSKIYVMFSGEDGKGSAKIIISDNSVGLDEKYFSVFLNGSLKNGDKAIVSFDAATYTAENPQYQAIKVANEYTVTNLSSVQAVSANPFDHVTISFTGVNGNGYAQITSSSDVFKTMFFYVSGTNGYLENGDVVTIKFNTTQFLLINSNYVIAKEYEQYTVTGLTDGTDSGLPADLQVAGSRNGYILPESNTRLYSEEFLSTLTDKQLKYARNEVTARRGRKFTTDELQDYFETRSWYRATYEPDYFDKYVSPTMNTYEHTNMETIKKIEQARKG